MDAGWSEEGECSTSADDGGAAGRIRKRRFSSARIQPTRIKKVMQSDEDIGRMVASVPVAIGSAMEHFAEKLLEASASCVQFSTSRTLSPMHIRYAVMKNPHFSFLEPMMKEIPLPKLSPAPDYPGSAPTQSGHQFFDYEQNLQHQQQYLQQLQSHSMTGLEGHFQQQQLPLYADTLKPFQPVNSCESIPPFHQLLPPSPINDLTSRISHIRPETISRKSASSTSKCNSSSDLDAEMGTKRKRGRPKKERKDRFVHDGFSEGYQRDEEKTISVQPKNGRSQQPSQVDDRLLMPPPTKLPIRPISSPRKSAEELSSSDRGTDGLEHSGPRSTDDYFLVQKNVNSSPLTISQVPTISGEANIRE